MSDKAQIERIVESIQIDLDTNGYSKWLELDFYYWCGRLRELEGEP